MTSNTQSHRSRSRRAIEPPQQHDTSFPAYASQPHPLISTSYETNTEYIRPGQDKVFFELTDVDQIMQDILDEIATSAPRDGSTSPSFTGSWINVGNPTSPSDWQMDDHTDSGVIIRHSGGRMNQAYPMESNAFLSMQTDDLPAFPTPESEIAGAWVHGADFVVDNQVMAEDPASERDFWLHPLSSTKPRTIHNNYEEYSFNDGNLDFKDTQNHHYVYTVPQPQMAIPDHGEVRSHSDEPWSHVDPQMSDFAYGYVLNLPSPGLQGEAELDRRSKSRDSSSEAYSPERRSSRPVKPHRARKTSSKQVKGNRTTMALTWEHATVSSGGLSFVPEIGHEEEMNRNGVRNGPLDSRVAEKAKRMRQIGACWKCWIQKVPCSVGDTCERCGKLKQTLPYSPTADQLCCRQGFKDYVSVFFPKFLHHHLQKRVIEDLVSIHTGGFIDGAIKVEISTGAAFDPMVLQANVFRRGTQELLRQSRLMAGTNSNVNSDLVVLDSLPIGILGLSPLETRKICSDHIDAMLTAPGYAEQVCAGDHTSVAYQLLKVMQKYAETDSLVHEALKLHAMHYFMSHLITFTAASVQTIVEHLKQLNFPSSNLDQFPSSRLLSRQIKQIVHTLHFETTKKLLALIEKSLRKRTKDYWAPTFAAILVLCLCMENLETAAHTLVVCDGMRGNEAEGFEKRDSAKACKELEDVPFAQCKNLLHEIYHSNKESSAGSRDAGFNPLRFLSGRKSTELKGEAHVMVNEVFNVVRDNWSEVCILAERAPLEDSGYEVEAGEIRSHNTGRLASYFLLSFFPEHFMP